MSDYKAGLPIRSEADGLDERLHAKLVDFTDPSGADKQLEISEKLVHTRMFAADPAGLKRQLKLSETGEMAIDGTYDASENTNPANIGLVTQERNATSADSRQTMKPTAKRGTTDTDVVALDISMHDQNGNAYTPTNPMPVFQVETEPGTEVVEFKLASSIAKDAVDNHDYEAVASFAGDHVVASGSGKIKVEIQLEDGVAAGTFTSKFVGFNSVANPTVVIPLKRLVVGAGVKIRVIMKNLDNAPQDLYSTIVGVEF